MYQDRKNRLSFFITIVYNNNLSALQKDIEPLLNKKYFRSNFHVQLNKNILNSKILDCLRQLGLNINWYLDGSGEMFADNDNGIKLKEKFSKYIKLYNDGKKLGDTDARFEQIESDIEEIKAALGTMLQGNLLKRKVAAGKMDN